VRGEVGLLQVGADTLGNRPVAQSLGQRGQLIREQVGQDLRVAGGAQGGGQPGQLGPQVGSWNRW
jgi:hypothetical protein